MRFYLGVHRPHWLEGSDVPLFVSHRTLKGRRTYPRARVGWALDSGGFTELSTYGEWRTSPEEYVDAVRRYRDEVGNLEWAAPQDWMCEPFIVAETGLSVAEHQQRTIANYLTLRTLAPELPFIPVLQGWELTEYHAHVEAYARAGVDLTSEPLVGVGSVCRRQDTAQAEWIVRTLTALGLRLHGFGVKVGGLARMADSLTSADSMAWSYSARRSPPLAGCTHRSCQNCWRYARRWRDHVVGRMGGTGQLMMAII